MFKEKMLSLQKMVKQQTMHYRCISDEYKDLINNIFTYRLKDLYLTNDITYLYKKYQRDKIDARLNKYSNDENSIDEIIHEKKRKD